MTISFVLRAAAPYLLRYECVQDGDIGDVATLANATILADAVPGPLKELWTRTGLDQGDAQALYAWDASSRVTIQMNVAGNSAVPVKAWAVSLDVDVDGKPVCVVYNDHTDAGGANSLLEIEFRHSTGR